ncbi:MAG: hypothetical protein GY832_28950 [Chloroflexi bacterium]|nr:hypothetical protein [Chloroflexota bacterium]
MDIVRTGISQVRIGSAAKGQRHETRPEELALIVQDVRIKQSRANLFDGSCAHGKAVAYLGAAWNCTTWGNEIEGGGYKGAKEILDHATHGPQESLEVKGYSDIFFNNPPYDMGASLRLEIEHVEQNIKWLRPAGIGIAVLPQHILQDSVFWQKWLNWMSDTEVRKYPEPEFGKFKQYVVYGTKMYHAKSHHALIREVLEWAGRDWPESHILGKKRVGIGLDEIHYYKKRAFPALRKITNGLPQGEQILGDLAQMPTIWDVPEWKVLTMPPMDSQRSNPSMPPGAGHIVQMAAAGMAHGQKMVIDDKPYMVTGSSYKYIQTTVVREENKEVTIRTEKPAYKINILCLENGHYVCYDSHKGQEEYAAFLKKTTGPLIEAVTRSYPPRYQMDYSECVKFFKDIHGPRILPGREANGLLTAQKHISAAILEILKEHKSAILVGEMGTGKASPLDTPILTPTGWKRMGDIKTGDSVIGSNGKATRVVGVYPQGEKDIYRVTLTDGTSTECCDDHLWQVNSSLRKSRGRPPRVLPLSEIKQNLTQPNGRNYLNFIPMVKTVKFNEQPVPLDPYLLGVLLGDGCMSSGCDVSFSNPDSEVVQAVEAALPGGLHVRKQNGDNCDYRITRGRYGNKHPVIQALRELGLMGKKAEGKFVPEQYLFNTPEVRLAVLQGILDTDGYIDARPNTHVIEHVTVSEQLARDVVFLAQSFGGRVGVSVKKAPQYTYNGERRTGQPAYRLTIALPDGIKPFRLSRKANRVTPRTKYVPTRAIKVVEFVGRKEARCIKVENSDGLYVTNDFIVTHNTMVSICTASIASAIGALTDKGQDWRIVVLAPAVVAPKWVEEADVILRDVPGFKAFLIGREVKQSHRVPDRPEGSLEEKVADLDNALSHAGRPRRAKIRKPITDTQNAMAHDGPAMLVIPYEVAKFGSPWKHTAIKKRLTVQWSEIVPTFDIYGKEDGTEIEDHDEEVDVFHCPDCYQMLLRENADGSSGRPWTMGKAKDDDFCTKTNQAVKRRCPHCNGILYCDTPFKKGGRFPVAEYLSQNYGSQYSLIIDEAHNSKSGNTAIGLASQDLISGARKVIAMTGTIFNGYARSLFHLMYRLMPSFRKLYKYDDATKFAQQHGYAKTVTTRSVRKSSASGYSSDVETTRVDEAPGASPRMVTMLMPQTVFLTLADIGVDLPPYQEIAVPVEMSEVLKKGYSSIRSHESRVKYQFSLGNKGPLAAWSQAMLGWLDYAKADLDEEGEELPGNFGAPTITLKDGEMLPKDEALLNLVKENLNEGRGVAVFFEQVNRRPAMGRVQKVLEKNGVHAFILTQKIKGEERMPWIREQIRIARAKGQEPVMLANGSLIKEGVDLLEFPTICEFGQHYNINTLRQRLRRSWRLGQTKDVRIYFLYYQESKQEEALIHIARKLRAAHQVDGNVAAGIAAFEMDENEFVQQLMAEGKRIAGGKLAELMQTKVVNDVVLKKLSSTNVEDRNVHTVTRKADPKPEYKQVLIVPRTGTETAAQLSFF